MGRSPKPGGEFELDPGGRKLFCISRKEGDTVRLALTSPGTAVRRWSYVETNREAIAGSRRDEQGIGQSGGSRGAGKG